MATGLAVVVVAAALAGPAGRAVVRRLWWAWLHRCGLRGHVLSAVLVGAPADVRHILRQVEKTPGAAYKVVGVVLDGPVAPGDATQDWGEAHRALCYVGIEEIDAAVRDLGADVVVVAGPISGDDRHLRDAG